MTDLLHHFYGERDFADLLSVDEPGVTLDHGQVATFAARLSAVPTSSPRRIDAWSVEQAGSDLTPFAWRAATARRVLATAALHRRAAVSVLEAVRDEIDEQLARALRGEAYAGSLAHWLAGRSPVELAIVRQEAVNWASTLLEQRDLLGAGAQFERADAYFTVTGAQTTLRGRRDLHLQRGSERIVVRVRAGAPGKSAGAGLRADLCIATFSDPQFRAPQRFIGLWPDAGLALSVNGTLANVRAGARDVVRVAASHHRRQLANVA